MTTSPTRWLTQTNPRASTTNMISHDYATPVTAIQIHDRVLPLACNNVAHRTTAMKTTVAMFSAAVPLRYECRFQSPARVFILSSGVGRRPARGHIERRDGQTRHTQYVSLDAASAGRMTESLLRLSTLSITCAQ